MKYERFRYIYPPRPSNSIPVDTISTYDNGTFLGQPKLNGSNCVIFTNGSEVKIQGRHNNNLSNFILTKEEILDTFKCDNKWMVINGEYLNKSKRDENNAVFNHKFCLFDIIVYNSDHLIGKTFEERVLLMDDLYGKKESEKEYLYSISDNIYRIKSYDSDFEKIYNRLTPIDLIEGMVFKRKSARLEMGLTESNNHRSQVKVRKPTKSYRF